MIDSAGFRAVLGRFASGVTVVTTVDDEGKDYGLTVSAFSSVSLIPPLVQICVGNEADTRSVLSKCRKFTVNILAENQEHVARRFSEFASQERFEGIGFTRGPSGIAVLEGILAHLECERVANHPAGDHTIFVGQVQSAVTTENRPLLYYRGGYTNIGK